MENTTVIGPKSTVVMHFTITLDDGSVADSTKANDLPGEVVLGDGTLTEGFEKNLHGLKVGDEKTFTVEAEDAFGEPQKENIYEVERERIPKEYEIEVGHILEFALPNEQKLPGMIREIHDDYVVVDFNHPLAGQRLTFQVEILEIK